MAENCHIEAWEEALATDSVCQMKTEYLQPPLAQTGPSVDRGKCSGSAGEVAARSQNLKCEQVVER